MAAETSTVSSPSFPAGAVIAIGITALAVAMGIGRFAFTPLLPLMLRDGTLDAAAGTEWAAANYIGYLLGALTAARFGPRPLRGLRLGLWGVALTTLLMGMSNEPLPSLAGAALRLGAGVCSAWTLVCASSWCLTELGRRGAAHRGAWIYTGVGTGIAAAGLLCWLGGAQTARSLWLELAALAAAGALCTRVAPNLAVNPAAVVHATAVRAAPKDWGLVLCYGSFGFGYILPATFLPAMASQQVDDPLVFGLAWPVFGLAAALSVAGSARWLSHWPRRRVWATAQLSMAFGTALLLASRELWALVTSAVLVGGTFMVATMAGLQLAREQAPHNPTPLLARMTVAFAVGQIAGPLLVRALGTAPIAGQETMWWGLAVATLVLALSAAWLAAATTPSSRTATQELTS